MEEGTKLDEDKLRYDLYPVNAYKGATKVLTFGAKKYAPNNWKLVKPKSRYYAALIRHLTAQIEYEENGGTGLAVDDETKLPHLDHAQCCLIFYRELTKDNEKTLHFTVKESDWRKMIDKNGAKSNFK